MTMVNKSMVSTGMERALDRALEQFSRVWHGFTGTPRSKPGRLSAPRMRDQIVECLEGRGGEVAARARTTVLARDYLQYTAAGKKAFLEMLAGEFGVDHASVAESLEQLPPVGERNDVDYQHLRQSLQPARMRLFRQLNTLEYGTRFLVEMRADVLALSRDNPHLRCLDADLKELLRSWFDVGFLKLQAINWDSPASLLEKLSDYEAVHRVRSWQDLKNRMDSDRRCFAFFHPCMEGEPLIFVEVAFVKGLSNNIQRLLDPKAPVQNVEDTDTAIFFSISNTQRGLSGISLGDFLIKRVVRQLQGSHPWIRTFATLSPIPGFCRWLNTAAEAGDMPVSKRMAADLEQLMPGCEPAHALTALLKRKGWHRDPSVSNALQPILSSLVAHYLLNVKRPDSMFAADPVANFHLSNGARVQRVNWLADTSRKGIDASAGWMVNYLYRLESIEDFHEAYSTAGTVNASSAVRSLLKY